MSNWKMSRATVKVAHGLHSITVTENGVAKGATVGAYAYGHSVLDTSSGSYGFTVTYKCKIR